jgi:hypothetical protein
MVCVWLFIGIGVGKAQTYDFGYVPVHGEVEGGWRMNSLAFIACA